jgi:uncharacterized protein YkwD
MRIWIWTALTAACTPMVQAPASPPPAASTATSEAAPGDPPAVEPASPSAPAVLTTSEDDAAAVEPAAAGRAAPRGDAAQWLDAHNRLRAKHCAAPLSWSARLADVAQHWANALRDRGCSFGHSGGTFGENLAAGTIGTLDPAAVVQMWYDEIAQYRFPDGGFSMKTGHFTQVVWRGSRRVGCGHSQCKGMDILVCEYDPAGNWEGQYRENVLPRGCDKR